MDETRPRGLCWCGCGQPAPLATETSRRFGNVKGEPQRYILGHRQRLQRGEENPAWRGGRRRDSAGYVQVYAPWHPAAAKRCPYVYEHRLVIEEACGYFLLPDEDVHHKNGVKDDNRLENLEAVPAGEHMRLHRRLTRWSRKHDCCQTCGTTAKSYGGHGMCTTCYSRWRRR